MSKIKYLIKRIRVMNYGKMFEIVKYVSNKTKKPCLIILFDVVFCGLMYGAGYMDYKVFAMYDLSHKQRKTYLTRAKNNAYIAKYNSKEKFNLMDDKTEFNRIFDKYLNRSWIHIKKSNKEEVLNWINSNEVFIGKVIDGTCGKGIVKIYTKEYSSSEEVYKFLNENNYMLLEQLVIQHDKLNELHPHSVNTVRLVTILKDGKTNIIASYLRIGNGKYVDNFNSGGMVAPINIKNGIIELPAIDKNENIYEKHPLTQVSIIGFKVPFWKECLDFVSEAAKVLPEIAYVGWDVSVTSNGPVFIEANPFPGHDIYQAPAHTPDKIGILPVFESIEKI